MRGSLSYRDNRHGKILHERALLVGPGTYQGAATASAQGYTASSCSALFLKAFLDLSHDDVTRSRWASNGQASMDTAVKLTKR